LIIIFDLDGTLIDSRGDIVASTNHVLREHGLAERSATEIASFVGDGARRLIARAVGISPEAPELEPLLEAFLSYYTAHPAVHTRLMPGARQALDALGSVPLAICTNKPRLTTDAVLAALGLSARFSAVVAGGDLPMLKPDPEPLWQIARQLGASGGEVVMVGDGPQDIEAGHAAGARTVGVVGNLLPEALLRASKPDVLLQSLAELPAVISRWSEAPSRCADELG
jgi:phosphoglycolate phosphatase